MAAMDDWAGGEKQEEDSDGRTVACASQAVAGQLRLHRWPTHAETACSHVGALQAFNDARV